MNKTFYRYESNDHVFKYTWTFDGHKETGYRYYYDGQLCSERTNYSYNGLIASWDNYTYTGPITTHQHVECEYLDETFQRIKYQKSLNPHSTNDDYDIHEYYYEYDGKKLLNYKDYLNGKLIREINYSYEGLQCTYSTLYNWPSYISETNYVILYLDDTYLREKTRLETRKKYDFDGNLTATNVYYYVYDYDKTKPIGYQYYYDGKLYGKGRDYNYDGLACTYFIDTYQDGEVVSTQMYEVEYLE